MRRATFALVALAAALCLAVPGTSWAYRFSCNGMDANRNATPSDGCACQLSNAGKWTTGVIQWRAKRTPPAGLTSASWLTAVNQAITAWQSVPCRSFSMREIGDVTTPDFGTNQAQQTLFWITSASSFQQMVGSGIDTTLGVTLAPYVFRGNCAGRDIVDADIAMNGAGGARWTTNMAACSGDCVNVASVLAHEMGHAQGLGHPCVGGDSNDCPSGGALMAAVSSYREDIVNPFQDDVNGICALYPGAPGALGSGCTSNTDCTNRLCVNDNGARYCSQTCGTCATGFVCTSGQCLRAGPPRVGEACVGSCEPGAFCLEETPTTRKCYKQCAPAASPTGCASSERCATIGDNIGACVPPGTRRPGETCGGTLGDCINGASCYILETGAPTGTCFQDCARDLDCPSQQRCLLFPADGGAAEGVCVGNRPEGSTCGENGQATSCADGLICLCNDAACAAGRCAKDCTSQPNSCRTGQRCDLLSDNMTKVCMTVVQEGQGCNEAVCAVGLVCIADTTSQYHCYRDCSSAACPAGKICHVYGRGTANQFSICETAPPMPDGGTGADGGARADGGLPDGGAPPNLLGFGEGCGADEECESGRCADLAGFDRVCATACDPRLGHHDCGNGTEREGCVPFDASDLGQGGLCLSGGQTGDREVGQACRGGSDCLYGICDQQRCTTWCMPDATCSNVSRPGYTCDRGEVEPGICRAPRVVAPPPSSGCSQAEGPPVGVLLVAMLLLAGLLRRRRPGGQRA